MSFLFPFYLAGVALIGVPVLLHMIRRHTRKRVQFSSLMFLNDTPPRIRSRRNIENLLLLFLRCLVLGLLAFAFSRPFFPRSENELVAQDGNRIVVLIDTSASMRRADIWPEAISKVQAVLKNLNPSSQVSLLSFDRDTRILMDFSQWASLDPAQRLSFASDIVSKLSPGWSDTRLGRALVAAAEAIQNDQINDPVHNNGASQVILISDLQQGCILDTLHGYAWPKEIELHIDPIESAKTTNASLQLVTNMDALSSTDQSKEKRIRIINSADATSEHFGLHWAQHDKTKQTNPELNIYVPPGRSVLLPMPVKPDGLISRELILTGDDHEFDNYLYVADDFIHQVNILFLGNDDENDPRQSLYYLKRAFHPTRLISPRLITASTEDDLAAIDVGSIHLIIAVDATIDQANVLAKYLELGRTILLVMRSAKDADIVARLVGLDRLETEAVDPDSYAMLGEIDFKHPLLSDFAEPRFSDFTKIHFWKYRRIKAADLPGAHVLAHFDSGDPAWIEVPAGNGTLLIFTSGWHREDSQLALSSKFVPLLYSILEHSGRLNLHRSQYYVADQIPIPQLTSDQATKWQIRKPNQAMIQPDDPSETFSQTEEPGIYTFVSASLERHMAVNLPPKESQTNTLPIEELEKFGIPLNQPANTNLQQSTLAKHHQKNAALENQQKNWRWILTAVSMVLMAEIWLAGWLTRPSSAIQGEQP